MKIIKRTGMVGLLVAMLVLAACNASPTEVQSTTDGNTLYTQAAETVSARLTEDAATNPPPTATEAPATATPTVPPAGAATATATLDPAAPTATTASAVVPSATAAAANPPAATGDLAELTDQSPEDGTTLPLNHTFNTQFTLKNIGTTTWTTGYMLRYYAGEKLGAPNDTNLTKEVKPGESVTVVFEMRSPSSKSDTNTVFVLSNKDGVNFYSMYVKLRFQ